eukprot:TRINITY_DN4193_c0_g1_i3.p1 TRINITY_DN4193_c0_g1~~TRINITY_DN4193_c0_g1_i3.p1  ORF type:complete len:207 (-),score=43.83 TRINITY_DN4193_c0_g1_i3:550-1170(-)
MLQTVKRVNERALDVRLLSTEFSPKGDYVLVGGSDGLISVWSVKGVFASSSSSEDLLCFGGGVQHKHAQAHNGSVYQIQSVVMPQQPDDRFVLSAGDDGVKSWKWEAFTEGWDSLRYSPSFEAEMNPDRDEINGVALLNEDTVIGGGGDMKLYGWDFQTGQRKFNFQGHNEYIHGVASVGDQHRAVTASEDGTVRFWGEEFWIRRR